ncbi:MAG: DUF1007 family protein [Parvibaculum sp.]|uniref:DUF1007 family protein n=1 Tax=Parvibaculum sp. TaxID=2024848 RepID=UPI003266F156
MRACTTAFLAVILLFAAPTSSRAHPHVWIDMRTEMHFDPEGRLTAIGVAWTFDEFYSAFAVEGAEKGEDGYDEELLAGLTDVNLENLAEWNYFTEVVSGDAPVTTGKAENGKSTWDDETGRLTLSFVVPLETPQAPSAATPVKIRVYDPSYYISIDYLKDDPVLMTGDVPAGCKVKTETPNVENVWTTLPESAFTSSSSQLGAYFAPVATVTCASAT